MAMSSKPLVDLNTQDYRKLCNLTKEGIYVNLVDKGPLADWVAQKFWVTIDVYPSE